MLSWAWSWGETWHMSANTRSCCSVNSLCLVISNTWRCQSQQSFSILHFAIAWRQWCLRQFLHVSKGEPFFRWTPSVSFTINSADWTMSKSTSWITVYNKCKKIISWHVLHGWHHVFQLQSQRKQMWFCDTLTQLTWKRTHVLIKQKALLIKPSNW